MAEALDPFGNAIQVGTFLLRTPNLEGEASEEPAYQGALGTVPELEAALENEDLETDRVAHVANTNEVDLGTSPLRLPVSHEPAIEVEVPDPGRDYGQILLYTDEAGVLTWHAAPPPEGAVTRGGIGGTRTYRVRRTVPRTNGSDNRGALGALGRKILRVLTFPILDRIGATVTDHFVGRWEERKRPYRIRTFDPVDYQAPLGKEISSREAWDQLSKGRALLMIHGTFGQTHTSFGSVDQEFIGELHARYQGRIFGFDHFTMSHDPQANVEWFLRHIPEGLRLDIDIISSSRGGLVGRTLVEKQSEFSLGSRTLHVRKLIFGASPNAGTPLADPNYLDHLVNGYTNILTFFPQVGSLALLTAIVTVIKQLAVGALGGLDGLQTMNPDGQFLRWLNAGGSTPTQYFALASNFEPSHPGLASFKDAVMDTVFRNTANDLVVPTSSAYQQNGNGAFPVQEQLVLEEVDSVPHGGLFSNRLVKETVLGWLGS